MLLADWMLTPLRILEMHPSCPIVSGDGEGGEVAWDISEVGVVEVLGGCVR